MQIWKPTEERSPVDQLTPGQRECLRLVQQLQSSKQIARALGISRYTVDQRIMLACRKLGVRSRAEAALMLAAYDRRNALATDQSDISVPDAFASSWPRPIPVMVETDEELRMFENGISSANQDVRRAAGLFRTLPLPSRERRVNRLSLGERLGWALAISFSSIIAFGVLLGALAAMTLLL